MKIPSKICQSCGNVFYRKPNYPLKRFLQPRKKYCSRECAFKGWNGRTPWNKGKNYTESFIKKMNLSGLEKGRGFFKGRNNPGVTGENNGTWKPKRIVTCPICNKELQFAPWEKSRKFCSLRCRGLGKRGSNSPVFKGENSLTKLRNRIRQMAEYTEWRLNCFRRDNFTCQDCKNPKSKPIEVHHLKAYAEIKKEYGFKSPEEARMCKILWDIKNGQTLCRTCHRATDTYAKNLK